MLTLKKTMKKILLSDDLYHNNGKTFKKLFLFNFFPLINFQI